jgi:YtkA-like
MSNRTTAPRSAIAAICFVALALGAADAAWAQVRATADVSCQPVAERLHYDCTIKLANSRTGAPLSGVTLTVGADMPSMPAAHNVRPVPAAEDAGSGTYRARIVLEMHGDWALRLDLSGAVRDRVIKLLRFESDRVGEPPPAPGHHRH